jgi:hypothetical protein
MPHGRNGEWLAPDMDRWNPLRWRGAADPCVAPGAWTAEFLQWPRVGCRSRCAGFLRPSGVTMERPSVRSAAIRSSSSFGSKSPIWCPTPSAVAHLRLRLVETPPAHAFDWTDPRYEPALIRFDRSEYGGERDRGQTATSSRSLPISRCALRLASRTATSWPSNWCWTTGRAVLPRPSIHRDQSPWPRTRPNAPQPASLPSSPRSPIPLANATPKPWPP